MSVSKHMHANKWEYVSKLWLFKVMNYQLRLVDFAKHQQGVPDLGPVLELNPGMTESPFSTDSDSDSDSSCFFR